MPSLNTAASTHADRWTGARLQPGLALKDLRPSSRRVWRNRRNAILIGLATLLVLIPVGMILAYIVAKGFRYMNLEFLTHSEPFSDRKVSGGFLNGLVGTALMVGIASAVSIPLGVLGAVYLGEYGKNLGWQYIFWDQVDGFMSPVAREDIGISLPSHVDLVAIGLPARLAYGELAGTQGEANDVLLTCGLWGQGPFLRLVWEIRQALPDARLHVVCGENQRAQRWLRRVFPHDPALQVHGVVDSLVPLLRTSRAIITKPGISTLIEAHAAQRKIFLVPGMPVAEANNARYALQHFGAEWFTADNLRRTYARATPMTGEQE